MFSMFPDGWAGAGLFLLRAAVGVVLIIQGAAYFGDKHELGFRVLAVVVAMSAVGFFILIGLLTRFAGVIAAMIGVGSVLSWFPAPSGPLQIPMTAALSAVIAVAVACLGPGALSLDARLFGRREIIIPTAAPNIWPER